MKIFFKNEVEAKLDSIYQWETYRGSIEGLPTKRRNKWIIDHTIQMAKTLCFSNNYCLLEPEEKPMEYSGKYVFGEPYYLPGIICIASLTSWQVKKDNSLPYTFYV